MRSKALASPYMAWMAIFTIVPLAVVAYYAFTNNAGEFTLDNLANAATYWPTFLRSVWYALAACVICLIIGYPVAYVIAQTGARTQPSVAPVKKAGAISPPLYPAPSVTEVKRIFSRKASGMVSPASIRRITPSPAPL